ncbi:MAG: TlpA family protein disulfide reductase [Phycisphaerales bacterium]|nr:TlpA family protein disulfide reductase [Phycisphaerales bacterium]
MSIRPTWLACVLLGVAGTATHAQDSTPNPPAADAPSAAPAASDGPAWPEIVKKDIHAGKDLRGRKAPELIVEEMLTDHPVKEGRVVLIDFWATWCPPCRATIPELNALQKKFRDDLVVIGISNEQPSKVRRFMEDNEMAYTQAIDTRSRTATEIDVRGIPHVLVISTDGVVRWQGFPLDPADRLTETIVKRIIDADPGVAARRKKDAEKK